jgi:DNA primase
MYGSRKSVSGKELFSEYSDVQVFEFYLGKSIEYGVPMLSPFRAEKKPSCNFFMSREGKTLFIDFGENASLSAVDFVMRMFHLDYNDAVNKIYSDMRKNKVHRNAPQAAKVVEAQREYTTNRLMYVEARSWSEKDLEYWGGFGIDKATLDRFEIIPAKFVWVDDKMIYRESVSDPCYAYRLGDLEYKLYFPSRGKSSEDIRARFICNCPGRVQGYDQLPESGEFLVITKSMKDVMLFHLFGINAVAPQAESYIIPKVFVVEMLLRFDTVVCLFDFDYAGVVGANRLKRAHGIQPIFLTNGRFKSSIYGAKDFSDFYKLFGEKAATALVDYTKSILNLI